MELDFTEIKMKKTYILSANICVHYSTNNNNDKWYYYEIKPSSVCLHHAFIGWAPIRANSFTVYFFGVFIADILTGITILLYMITILLRLITSVKATLN